MESTKILDKIADIILSEHNFNYSNFDEAKSTISIPDSQIEITYDRLTLYFYSHNLSTDGNLYIQNQIGKHLSDPKYKEHLKTMNEYYSLFWLLSSNLQFNNYSIKKQTRPDFVLTGTNKIGIEVTQLTTAEDCLFRRICNDNLGKYKTSEEIHQNALRVHGKKANNYIYRDKYGQPSLARAPHNLSKNTDYYINEILKKYHKYSKMFSEFDEFIILGDARSSFTITSKRDIDYLVTSIQESSPEVTGFTLSIIYNNNGNHHECYKL